MFVTTIVPTRNRPLLLRTALDAIARQSYPLLEVVVVDDGSTAEHAQANARLVEALGERGRLVYLGVVGACGSGPSAVRNAGIAAARGEVIAFCDDDDNWCDDRHVEFAMAAFVADPTLDLVFANQETRVDGRPGRAVWLPSLVARLPAAARDSDSIVPVEKADCLIDDHAHMNTCLFRRSLLNSLGGFWEGVRYLEDLDLFVRAVDQARGVGYRPRSVAIHNVPNRALQVNASTSMDACTKELVPISVASHLVQVCRTREARGFAGRIAGYTYRNLARQAAASGRHRAAFAFARAGLAWLPTWNWGAYTAVLGIKALVN